MKFCNKCKTLKSKIEFHVCKANKDLLQTYCKYCRSKHSQSEDIKISKREYDKNRYKNNSEKIKLKVSDYYNKNKRKIFDRITNRLKTDINKKLICSLRNRFNKALKNNYKTGSAVRDLGCSISELKIYLEKQFTEGMTWENYGRGINCWNIDHKIPLSKVDLADRVQLLRVLHYTNLQPLWTLDNLRKSNKYGD